MKVGPSVGGAGVGATLAIYLEHALGKIHDPIRWHAGARVETALVLAVEIQARLGDLHQERGPRGMRMAIVPKTPGYYAHVRLGLGLVVESNGHLGSDDPAGSEGRTQCFLHGLDRRGVPRSLRLADEQRSPDQLETLSGAEDAQVHEPLVLDPTPALGAHGTRVHRPQTRLGASGSSMCRVRTRSVGGLDRGRAARQDGARSIEPQQTASGATEESAWRSDSTSLPFGVPPTATPPRSSTRRSRSWPPPRAWATGGCPSASTGSPIPRCGRSRSLSSRGSLPRRDRCGSRPPSSFFPS